MSSQDLEYQRHPCKYYVSFCLTRHHLSFLPDFCPMPIKLPCRLSVMFSTTTLSLTPGSVQTTNHPLVTHSGNSCTITSSLRSPNVPSAFPSITSSGTSISHGFRRFLATGLVAFSGRTVEGMSLIPGIGAPVVMRWTISAKVCG